jgi:RNA polymerase subunit RPABC4/transcription elongation factor Spt4
VVKKRRELLGIPHYSYHENSGRKKTRRSNYQYYLQTFTWKNISYNAIKAMNGKCEFCGSKSTSVHHIYYPKNQGDLGLEDIASLCVVCKKCHDVLHGHDWNNSNKCSLCGNSDANNKLAINISHLGKRHQRVCQRCKYIATGFREKAYQWSWDRYVEWIKEWRELMFADYAKNNQEQTIKKGWQRN